MPGVPGGGVSAWRGETSSDLSEARRLLTSVVDALSGEPTKEQLRSIWLSYVLVEKSIAFIKVDISEENPGRFLKAKAYTVPDERQALQFALRNLVKGTATFQLGDFVTALKELRESRNYLRALLREKRLRRVREARKRP
jgi:hypothetical protein